MAGHDPNAQTLLHREREASKVEGKAIGKCIG